MSKIVGLETGRSERQREFRLEDLSTDAVVDTGFGNAEYGTSGREPAAGSVARFPAASSGDWSNEELASIYRALRLLQGAGVAVEVDRGVTDDGSPWCIFCSAQGDVLVHIARIDRGYVLDGVGLEAPIRGRTFDELIDRFVGHRRDDAAADRKAGLSDILDLSKRRDEKLFVHPAAQLAALLWAAMVVKDIALAQEMDAVRGAEFPGSGNLSDGTVEEDRSGALTEARHRVTERSEVSFTDMSAKFRDSGGQTNVMQSAGLMSLAYFLVGPEQMSPTAVLERHVPDLKSDLDESAAATAEASGSLAVFAQALEAVVAVAAFLGDTFQPVAREAGDAGVPDGLADIAIDLPQFLSQLTSAPETAFAASLVLESQGAIGDPVASGPQEVAPAGRMPTPPQQKTASTSFEDLLDYLQTAAFSMPPNDGMPTEDIFALIGGRRQVDGDGWHVPTGPGKLAPPTPEEMRAADSDVISAILQFLRTADDELTYYRSDALHVIEQGDVLSEGDTEFHTFSWTFDDGSQIMIVGTTQDLAGFDLFA